MQGITRTQIVPSVSSHEAFAAIDARKQAALEEAADNREEALRIGEDTIHGTCCEEDARNVVAQLRSLAEKYNALADDIDPPAPLHRTPRHCQVTVVDNNVPILAQVIDLDFGQTVLHVGGGISVVIDG